MTKFNPENKEVLTYAECIEPAMKIKSKKDATQYLNSYALYIQKSLTNGESAIDIAKQNLGYYAGYYGNDVRKRVEKLFDCSHPIFGKIKENGSPTAIEAFECGKNKKTLSEIRKQNQL